MSARLIRKLTCRLVGHGYAPMLLLPNSWASEDGRQYVCECPWQCERCGKVWVYAFALDLEDPAFLLRLRPHALIASQGPGRWE